MHRNNVAQFLVQERHAHRAMVEMMEYAEDIGCVVIGDEVLCDKEQAELLREKFEKISEPLSVEGDRNGD